MTFWDCFLLVDFMYNQQNQNLVIKAACAREGVHDKNLGITPCIMTVVYVNPHLSPT